MPPNAPRSPPDPIVDVADALESPPEVTSTSMGWEEETTDLAEFRVFDSIHAGVFVVDARNRQILYANPYALKVLGRAWSEVQGRVCHGCVCPAEQRRCPILDLGQRVDRSERVAVRPDGTQVPVRKRVVAIEREGRTLLLESFVDLRELRDAESDARREQRRARLFLDMTGAVMVALDRRGRVTLVNQAACRLLLRSREELIGANWVQLCIPPALREEVQRVYEGIMASATDGPTTYENPVLNAKGEERWFFWTNTILYDDKGQPVGTLSAGLDLTEERRAQEAHMLDEERLEALLQLRSQEDMPEEDLIRNALEEAVHLTRSEGGYFHFVNEDQQSLSLGFWSSHVRETCKSVYDSHYPLHRAGVWADSLRTGRPVVHNDFSTMENRKGLPEGHFTLRRHLGIPIHDGRKIVAVAGVANKPDPYDDADIRQLLLFFTGTWAIVKHMRAQEALRKSEEKFRALAETQSGTLDRLRAAFNGTVEVLSRAVETRDPYTAGHQRRVSNLARAIGLEMGLEPFRVEAIRMAGVLHDIGKIAIPAEILAKPTRLSRTEFSLIQAHPQVAWDMLAPVQFPWPLHDIIVQHHEVLDGSGYPNGLKGDQILLEARILTVADIVEAMASHRPYRPALGLDKALAYIEEIRDSRLDPRVVDACVRVFRERGYTL